MKFPIPCTINTALEDLLLKIEKDLIQRAFATHKSSRKVAKALKISQNKASRLIRKHISSNPSP